MVQWLGLHFHFKGPDSISNRSKILQATQSGKKNQQKTPPPQKTNVDYDLGTTGGLLMVPPLMGCSAH